MEPAKEREKGRERRPVGKSHDGDAKEKRQTFRLKEIRYPPTTMMVFRFTWRVCAMIVLINGLIMRIRPLGIELSLPFFYFDSRPLPGTAAAFQMHIFIVRFRAAFTHECPTLT